MRDDAFESHDSQNNFSTRSTPAVEFNA